MGEEARVGRGPGSSWVFFVSVLVPTGNLCCCYQLCPVGGSDSWVLITPNLHSTLHVLLEVVGFLSCSPSGLWVFLPSPLWFPTFNSFY